MKKVIAFFTCITLSASMLILAPSAALADETQPAYDASPAPVLSVTSSYALLSGIDATAGTWNKEFSGSVSSYILTLDETVETVTIAPQKGDASQTLTINSRLLDSVTVSVDHGNHKHVTIVVRQTGKRTKVYYVKVVREKSSNNDLAALSVSPGVMDSEFDPALREYDVALDCYSPFVTVTAAKADPHAKLRIGGHLRTSMKYRVAPGAKKTVKITVCSQTNVAKSYILHIKREVYPISDKAEALIDFAKRFIGTPYVHGGKTPAGFDCSGFVYYCLNGIGIKIGYMTSASWPGSGYETIPTMEKLLPGDILCFKGHVGIYMGDYMMIDSAHSVNGVTIKSCATHYWTENFICGKRVIKQES